MEELLQKIKKKFNFFYLLFVSLNVLLIVECTNHRVRLNI